MDDTEKFIVRGPVVPIFNNGFNYFVVEYKVQHIEFCRVSFPNGVNSGPAEARANYIATLLNIVKE